MIPLNAPDFGALEEQYVLDALRSGWVTTGPYVERFERAFAAFTNRRHAVACSSGTAALWLALMALRLPQGVPVLTQTYTCDAVLNAALRATAASPLVVDVDEDTWGMRADHAEEIFQKQRISALSFAHIYGAPCRDTADLLGLARTYGVPVIEDASEAHGAAINGAPVGSFGEISVFSCRGEKVVGGGQLGVAVTDDAALARRVRQFSENGLPAKTVRYWSTVPGLNCQPAHLNAALACAQLERIKELLASRRAIHDGYVARLAGYAGLRCQRTRPSDDSAWWLTGVLLEPAFTAMLPQDLGAALAERGIQTRPGFYGLHRLPHAGDVGPGPWPMADRLLERLLILPSGPTVTPEQQDEVVEAIMEITGRA